jgi:hypothetical protein
MRVRRRQIAAVQVAMLALLGLTAGEAHAGFITIFSDNFNEEAGGGVPYLNFHHWNVVGGTVDVISAPLPTGSFNPSPADGFFVDLAGSGTPTGELVTKDTFTLAPGEYQLSFMLAGRQLVSPNPGPSSVLVTFGSVYNETFDLPFDQPFTLYARTIDLTTATSGNLTFHQTAGDLFAGALLDNVQLVEVTVPEPPASLLLAVGMVILLGYNRRKKLSAARL